MDIEERNIQEAIGQFYSFFGGMSRVKNEIEGLSMDDHTKDQIFAQLDEIESKLGLNHWEYFYVWVFGCHAHVVWYCSWFDVDAFGWFLKSTP